MEKVVAVMAGSIWKVLVKAGDSVAEGQDVVILESMKMEIPISVPQAGVVRAVHVKEGDFVSDGDVLADLE